MIFDPLKLRAHAAPWNAAIEFLAVDESGDQPAIAQPLVFETVPQGVRYEPTFSLSTQAAQNLMDDLWNAGLRLTEGTGSAGSLRATEKHLGDMRAIVARKLDVDLK